MIAKTLEVLVEVHDAKTCALSGGRDSEVGKGEAVSTMRPAGGKLAHGGQNRALHTAVHGDLA